MTFADLVTVSVGVAAIIGATFAAGKLAVVVNRGMRRAARLIDDLIGEPERPGFVGRPGVLVRLAAIEGHTADVADVRSILAEMAERVADLPEIRRVQADVLLRLHALEQQMRPNGGNSLRDAIDRTEAAVTAPHDQPIGEAA